MTINWYPKRGLRCNVVREARGGWYFGVGVGPVFVGMGPGTPLP